ncbi:hypothetical protein FRC06_009709 [Ceratobasidium sp. 370]|nr:hypothetical protein FRC06_009709 [Ceratobasidium sp. 370]
MHRKGGPQFGQNLPVRATGPVAETTATTPKAGGKKAASKKGGKRNAKTKSTKPEGGVARRIDLDVGEESESELLSPFERLGLTDGAIKALAERVE